MGWQTAFKIFIQALIAQVIAAIRRKKREEREAENDTT